MENPWRGFRPLVLLFAAAFILRIGYCLAFVDLDQAYYWEYGELAKNLRAGNGYALFHAHEGQASFLFDPAAHPVPSAYMPPGYVAFLYPFLSVDNVRVRSILLLSVQAALGAVVVVLIALLTRKFVSPPAAIVAGGIAAFLPEFIYASGSYTPTVLYQLFVLLFLMGLYVILSDRERWGRSIMLLVPAGLAMLYLRAESLGLLLLAALLLVRAAGWQRAFIFVLLVGLGYAPWVIRNTVVFGQVVPMTTSGGLNLFRGHNPEGRGAWSDEVVDSRKQSVPLDSAYELSIDGIYRTRVWENVKASPGREVVSALQKVLYLWLADPEEPRALHPLYLVPWAVILAAFVYGIRVSGPAGRHLPIYTYLGYTTLIAALFFVLPRYQTMMKVALIPMAAAGVRELWIRFVDFPRRIS